MALDEALLCEVMTQTEPVFIVRTYRWVCPTLSLGVHQPEKDISGLLERYGKPDIVRRPTGGRAILHGEDISFAFITNQPELLKLSVNASYCELIQHIKAALIQMNINVADSCEESSHAYTRSAVCFETLTPSDLTLTDGRKIVGSAQCRRAGGMLQHGSIFADLPYEAFSSTLFEIVAKHYQCTPQDYLSESGGIVASAETTNGSQRLPASA